MTARVLFVSALLLLMTACRTSSTVRTPTVSAVATRTQPAGQLTQAPGVTPSAASPTLTPSASAPATATPLGTAAASSSLVSEGRQIYFTGVGPDGQRIPRSATSAGGMMGGMMGSAGCATCHGQQGQGERTMMFSAPNITYRNLTDPEGMIEPDGGRGPTYTDAEIQRAVVQGIGADGDQLDTTMPRWQLSDQEFTALLAYLKTLP